mmetsp:Transcript_28838/g.42561  ORF Transcript_28838/g.42561 Transcript_28838/m.42561 type:complete len:108 (-) Transcript_28838:53-376(-)
MAYSKFHHDGSCAITTPNNNNKEQKKKQDQNKTDQAALKNDQHMPRKKNYLEFDVDMCGTFYSDWGIKNCRAVLRTRHRPWSAFWSLVYEDVRTHPRKRTDFGALGR